MIAAKIPFEFLQQNLSTYVGDTDGWLATGVIEGACRYVVGERLDCSGMRWKLEGAEPLLQLRCIELNGDWDEFIAWATDQTTAELQNGKRVTIRHQKPKSEPKPKKQAA